MSQTRAMLAKCLCRALFPALLIPLLSVGLYGFGLGETIQYYPQFAVGGGATTSFNLYNPGDHEIAVNLAFYRSDGTLFLSDSRTIGSQVTVTAEYGGQAGTATDGWVALTSLEPFAASQFFAIEGVGNVGVPAAAAAQQFQFFSFHAEATNTGFAVANPNPAPSVLNLRFYDPVGVGLQKWAVCQREARTEPQHSCCVEWCGLAANQYSRLDEGLGIPTSLGRSLSARLLPLTATWKGCGSVDSGTFATGSSPGPPAARRHS